MVLLTLVFTTTYSVNMVLAEIYFEQINDMMQFILLKYCLGTTHHLLSPAVILLCYPEVNNIFSFLQKFLFQFGTCHIVGSNARDTVKVRFGSGPPQQ